MNAPPRLTEITAAGVEHVACRAAKLLWRKVLEVFTGFHVISKNETHSHASNGCVDHLSTKNHARKFTSKFSV
jgi:hypothetical protein